MAYTIDGNLYLQDGTNPPIQLTNDERRDHTPVFSDDGEKIVFGHIQNIAIFKTALSVSFN